MAVEICNGRVEDVIPTLPRQYFDAVLTDGPYGLKIAKWDDDVPSEAVWSAISETLKPGSPILSFGSARTWHRMATAIEAAGLEIRDCLAWLYGRCYPSVTSMARRLSSRDVKIACDWEAYHTQLRTYHVPIVLARKPLDRSIVENVIRWDCGPLNSTLSNGKTNQSAANVVVDEDVAAALDADGASEAVRRYFYCYNASPDELNAGLNGHVNPHPTCKPIALTTFLAQLLLPPPRQKPRRLLIPYAGVFSEVIGAILAGWDEVVAIEVEPEYCRIGKLRLAHFCGGSAAGQRDAG